MAQVQLFLSTPSARRATVIDGNNAVSYEISIHALREEGDLAMTRKNFSVLIFLSTPSARRATFRAGGAAAAGEISIHALREEGDFQRELIHTGLIKFLSTPSARRATAHVMTSLGSSSNFYPRPPRGGRLFDG